MKKIVDVSIAGIPFTLEDDAYTLLKNYLARFETTMPTEQERKEVMEDVEARVAEIFQNEKKYLQQIIDIKLVKYLIAQLGEIEDVEEQPSGTEESEKSHKDATDLKASVSKRLYRDPDKKKIAGVCSGLAIYFGIDVTIVRLAFVLPLIAYGATLWIYIILWIVTEKANTISQKLEMNGIPVTAENIKAYSAKYSQFK